MNIIVVGSGIAGLIAALELAGTHHVTLVTKSQLSEANTRYAQGGIAAVMHADDNVAEHIEDTLRAGAGLCRPEAVEILCTEGPDRIRDLIALGVAFDRHNGELAQGREAAHSRARVLHAGGDATGLAIETALVVAVQQAAGITVFEHTFARDLHLKDDRVAGLHVIAADGQPRLLPAKAVLLAAGGAGHLYPYTTNPPVATGDGVALALRAGAQLADLEFYQFHPTALSAEGGFLISEAVRGDGAVLRALDGTRFMQAIHPDAELAPRDVVARGIAAQMKLQGNQPVLLDATHLGAAFLAERFPTINAACARAGLDWATQPIPVAPAAHYWMGGVQTDTSGRTSLPGLFAAGEVACTGVHGANRLASNSLLESIVFSHRAARLLRDDPTAIRTPATFPDTAFPDVQLPLTPQNPDLSTEADIRQRSGIRNPGGPPSAGAPSSAQPKVGYTNLPFTRTALQQLMWAAAGIVRTEAGLRTAQAELHHWLTTTPPPTTIAQHEDNNLLRLAEALVTAALHRTESRGAHFRADYPELNEAQRHHLTLAQPQATPA